MREIKKNYQSQQKKDFAEIIRYDFVEPDYTQDLSLPEAVGQMSTLIAQHIKSSKHVRKYVEEIAKGKDSFCPNSPVDEIIKYLAEQNGQIDKSDAALNLKFLDSFMFPIFDFERECFLKLFTANPDASHFEANLFAYSIELGEMIDILYYEWFKGIVVPYQSLRPSQQSDYEYELKKQLDHFDCTFDYTIFHYHLQTKQFHTRAAWAEEFPEIIKELVDIIEELTDSCIEFGEKELHDYFKALGEAYACRVIDDLEEKWAEVDRMWIKIPNTCRMFPIHGMENGYEHPFGVSPEYKLVVRTEYGGNLISEIRGRTPYYAEKIGIDSYLVSLAQKKLSNLDMGVFSTAMNSGVCANFRSAGQVVPNRQDILNEGGKIFMNLEGAHNAVKVAKGLLFDNCYSEMGIKLANLITADHFLSHTIGHECNHPVGCTPQSDELLGEAKNRLEEAKATIGGLGVILDSKNVTAYPEVVALCIARVCRFFTKATYENPTMQAYVRENLAVANLLISARIVSLRNSEEKYLSIDLSEDHLQNFAKLLNYFYKDVIAAYSDTDPVAKVTKLEKLYCFENQTICNWQNLVNGK